MKPYTLLTLFIVFMALFSCKETKKVVSSEGEMQLTGLYHIKIIKGNEIKPSDPSTVFISFDLSTKTISGNTGCNAYFGNYQKDENTLGFNDIGQTEMACDEAVMKIEWGLMEALRDTGFFSIENKELTLYSKLDKSPLLKATKQTIKN